MTYLRRNSVDEQQEACQKARQITAICEQFQITLDPIDWQQFGMWAPVKVNNVEIASLLELRQRDSDDILRQVQIKLFAHAALETLHARPGLKALMWSQGILSTATMVSPILCISRKLSSLFYLTAMIIDPSLTRLDDIIINSHRNNVGGSDAQHVRHEIFHDLLSSLRNGLNRTPHLDQARSPGR